MNLALPPMPASAAWVASLLRALFVRRNAHRGGTDARRRHAPRCVAHRSLYAARGRGSRYLALPPVPTLVAAH